MYISPPRQSTLVLNFELPLHSSAFFTKLLLAKSFVDLSLKFICREKKTLCLRHVPIEGRYDITWFRTLFLHTSLSAASSGARPADFRSSFTTSDKVFRGLPLCLRPSTSRALIADIELLALSTLLCSITYVKSPTPAGLKLIAAYLNV